MPADRLVGLRIAALRKAASLSQTALGTAAGVTFQQIQKYESGRNRVPAGRLSLIADRLTVPVAAFFAQGDDDRGDDQADGVGSGELGPLVDAMSREQRAALLAAARAILASPASREAA